MVSNGKTLVITNMKTKVIIIFTLLNKTPLDLNIGQGFLNSIKLKSLQGKKSPLTNIITSQLLNE